MENTISVVLCRKTKAYSPSKQAMAWDRSVSHKHGCDFDPKPVLQWAKLFPPKLDQESRRQLVEYYINVSHGLQLV